MLTADFSQNTYNVSRQEATRPRSSPVLVRLRCLSGLSEYIHTDLSGHVDDGHGRRAARQFRYDDARSAYCELFRSFTRRRPSKAPHLLCRRATRLKQATFQSNSIAASSLKTVRHTSNRHWWPTFVASGIEAAILTADAQVSQLPSRGKNSRALALEPADQMASQ